MFKLIILGAILYGIYRFFGGEIKLPSFGKSGKSVDSDTLVECSSCGTYVTKKEAIEFKGNLYCSKECLPN